MSRSRRKQFSSIETLESRIAPALLIVGANLLGAPGGPSSGSTSIGGNSVTVVQVVSGEAIVWWDGSFIDAISFGPNCKLSITGNAGDIVGNLTASGQLSNSMKTPLNGLDGDVLLANNLLGLTTHPLGSEKGDVNHIITGGSVSNVNIAGELNGIYAGDGVFFPGNGSTLPASELLSGGVATSNVDTPSPGTSAPYSINPLQPGGEYAFNFTLATSKTNLANNVVGLEPSASIQNITMATAGRMQVFAGSGNPNDLILKTAVPGGSINDLSLQTGVLIRNNSGYLPPNAVYSYYLLAGDGSSGPVGGAGGSITNITEVSSAGEAILQAGQGGVGSHGAGGAGGSVVNLNLQSDSTQYLVNAGNGGVGTPGGPGGKLTDNNFANRTQTGGILVPGNFTGAAAPNGTGSGADDLMVIDQGTGNMILEENVGGTGTDFVPVVQYNAPTTLTSPGGPVTIIPAEGTTPIGAAAVYLEGPNAPLDLVVAYQGGELVAYINQGGGVFYSQTLTPAPGFPTSSVSLPFTPSHMVALDPYGNALALSANIAGTPATSTTSATPTTSELFLAGLALSTSTTGLPSLQVSTTFDIVDSTITALKGTGNDTLFTGTAQGEINYYSVAGFNTLGVPFTSVMNTTAHVTGGISQLALDSSGHILLAVSSQASTISDFNFNLSNPTPLTLLGTLTGFQGNPVQAHFIESVAGMTATQSGQPDSIAVLSQFKSDSAITQLLPQASTNGTTIPPGYTVSQTVSFNETVNEFVPDYPNLGLSSAVSLAVLTNAVNKFEVSTGFGTPVDYALPFASKSVVAAAGDGGDGVDYTGAHGLVVGAGGAGGSIYGLNAQAHVIELTTGTGGSTETGAGGAGGSIGDPTDFTSGGAAVTPSLISDDILQVNVGDGGSPTDPGPKASGGNGGSIDGLAITLNSGNMTLTAGAGGDSMGGNAGNGGSITGLMATDGDGNITAIGGDGGAALDATGAGGLGGSIVDLHYQLSLLQSVAVLEKAYSATLTAGMGGSSIGGAGGAGGSITGANLNINPSFTSDMTSIDAGVDNTAQSILTAGHGGDGVTGGAGGSIQALTFFAYDDQISVGNNTAVIDPVTLSLVAGYGGKGTHGNGGNGGSVNLATPIEGVSFYDNAPTTTVAETTPGVMSVSPEVQTITFGAIQYEYELTFKTPDGHGGFITGTTPYFYDVSDPSAANQVENALNSLPSIIAATEGAGVTVTSGSNSTLVVTFNTDGPQNLLVATPLPNQDSFTENPLVVIAGHGGDGSVKGGAGGSITGINSENAPFFNGAHIAYEELFGASLTAGNGGNGGTSNGGAGGSITGSSIGFQNAMLDLTAGQGGNGGVATGALPTATGGAGGSIVSSVFGLVGTYDPVGMEIVAGAGGSGIAAGGVGGSVIGMTINTSEGTAVPSALIYAGDGGAAASAVGAGGKGGSITGISQTKDINSSIDVLQAGNGGDNTIGHGGVGGNVTNIHSVGFIGRPTNGFSPLGVFDTIDYTVDYTIDAVTIPQGIFSGDGGTGGTSALDAASGYVENVSARQIAAISAAENPSTQLFAAASKIANITAEVVGFDVNRTTDGGNPVYVGPVGATPGTDVPVDGFIWSLTAATGMHIEFPEPAFVFVGS